MQRLAIGLAQEAGDYAVARAATTRPEAKGDFGDVVTEVDRACEERIIAAILHEYPDHSVLGEETGLHGLRDTEYRWLIDPLDGTNNFVLGVDYFGVCITVCREDRPVVAVVHDSPKRRTFSAVAGSGASLDGRPVTIQGSPPLRHSTIAWTQGYGIDPDDGARNSSFSRLERSCKRVLRSWCPSVDWGLIATGRLGGLVAYRNEPWDLVAGALIAQEAGAGIVSSTSGDWVVVAPPALLPELIGSLGIELPG
jgi:myo-inositol-1(or 4)-monophosphatase